MKTKSKIDPMKGVVKPDTLTDQIRASVAGNVYARSYVKGAFQYLTRKPPNPYIVPLLKRALEMSK